MATEHREPTPDQALRTVLDRVTDYTAEPELGTYSALMTAVTQYGRACAQAERVHGPAEQAAAERHVRSLEPSDRRTA